MAEENFRVRKGITVDGSGYSAIKDSLKIGYISTLTSNNTILGGNDAQLRVSGRSTDSPGIIQLSHFDNNNFYGGTGVFTLGKIQFAMNENSNDVTTVATIEGITSDPNDPGHFDGALKFFTSQGSASGANLTEKMILTADGRVGIGTTSPARPLHVVGDIYAQTGDILLSRGNYYLQDASDGTKRGSFASDGVWAWENVNVGIGTTSPQSNLHISSGTSGDAVLILEADTDNNDETDQPYIVFEQDGGTQHSAIGSHSGSSTDNNALIFSNSVSSSGVEAGMIFKTGTSSGYANATERMRITPAGNIGIGQSSPACRLDVVASFDPSSSATQFTYAETLKLNVRDSDSDEGPAIRFRHGATSDHNSADYMFQVNGDGGSMVAYEYGFNYGFNKWYLANSADGTKPLMKFDSGGSGSAGQTMYGELLITSTATAWDVYDGTHTGLNPTTFDSQIFLSGGADSYINNGQNFGIGTTSPSSILHVKEASTINSVANSARMIVSANGGDSYIHLMESTDGHNIRHTASDNSLRFRSTLAGSDLMTLTSGGSLGIGTTSPSTELHVSGADHPSIRVTGTDNANADPAIELLGTADNFTEGGQLWYDNGTGVLHLSTLYVNDAADIQFHTKTGTDRSTSNVRMTIAGDGNVGIGTTSPTHLLHLDHNATNPDTDADFAIKIDHDSTGATPATTGDREQGGLYVDADSSTTGGDQSNEHRLYGVWSDTRVNSSGDPDAVYAVYGYSEDQRNGTSGMTNITNLAGGWFIGASDANNTAPAISSLYGLYGSASIQDNGTINNAHSVRALTTVSGNRAQNTNNLRGVSSEIDIAGSRSGGDITINWARVVEAVFDHNATDASGDTAVVTDGYLYYGDYAVSQSDQITNKWGLYINDEDKNYISGNLGIGTTAPDAPLHVEHSSGLIAKMGEGNVETRMQFADARAMIGYQGDHAIIQGGSGGKGVSLNVNNGTFGSGVALRVTSDGDVGIGTTSPEGKLEIEQDTTTGHALKVYRNQSSSNMDSSLVLLHDDSQYADEVTLHVKQDGTGYAGVFEGGNVGIGTTSPGHLLEVAGGGGNGEIVVNRTSGAEILLQAQSATGVIGTSTNHDLALKTNGSTRMQIENGGNVGIGDTTPSYKLDVNGSIRAVDDIYTDKLIASEGIRSSSRASFNTMQMYYYDRQSMGTQAVLLRLPVGGSSTANPSGYYMPHAGVVMQVLMGFYAQTLATSGTDTWSIIKTDTNGTAQSVDFDVNFANLNRIGTTNGYNILIDISVLADASNLDFVAGDMLQIQRTDSSPISIGNCNAQLWVTFDI